MTAPKKVLLALAVVASGYGLAALCGAPTTILLSRSPGGAAPAARATPTVPNPPESAPPPGHWALDGARLIPDSGPTLPEAGATEKAPLGSGSVEPKRLTLEPVASPPSAEAMAPVALTESAGNASAPRARLRNEAPRALAVEAAAPVVVKSLEPLQPASASQNHVQQTQLLTPPSITSYETTVTAPSANAITPQPYPSPDEIQQPRRHIIVDGDSLARLAGRYLNDPHRSEEIFEFNRHLLSDPELLPIGAEIVIPPRSHRAGTSEGPHSFLTETRAVHSAARGLVPVRPIPSSPRVTPRAQLSRPRPAE